MTEFDIKIKEDPEILDPEDETCGGGEEHYDNNAVATVPFDDAQFELPEDFEVEEEDDDDD